MNPWLLRLGRLALARTGYQAIGGWRRLLWRFWWRQVHTKKLPPVALKESLETQLSTGPMHWSCDGRPLPFCGAFSRGARWTTEYSSTNCDGCKEKGLPVVMRYWMSTR